MHNFALRTYCSRGGLFAFRPSGKFLGTGLAAFNRNCPSLHTNMISSPIFSAICLLSLLLLWGATANPAARGGLAAKRDASPDFTPWATWAGDAQATGYSPGYVRAITPVGFDALEPMHDS
jgi:hypothetical protein